MRLARPKADSRRVSFAFSRARWQAPAGMNHQVMTPSANKMNIGPPMSNTEPTKQRMPTPKTRQFEWKSYCGESMIPQGIEIGMEKVDEPDRAAQECAASGLRWRIQPNWAIGCSGEIGLRRDIWIVRQGIFLIV
jgi:hypothetical protein